MLLLTHAGTHIKICKQDGLTHARMCLKACKRVRCKQPINPPAYSITQSEIPNCKTKQRVFTIRKILKCPNCNFSQTELCVDIIKKRKNLFSG